MRACESKRECVLPVPETQNETKRGKKANSRSKEGEIELYTHLEGEKLIPRLSFYTTQWCCTNKNIIFTFSPWANK